MQGLYLKKKFKCLLQGSGTFDFEYYLHSCCRTMSRNPYPGVPRYALQSGPFVSDINNFSLPSSY